MAKILIAGCGQLGIALANLLLIQKHQIWGLRRKISLLPNTILPIQADLSLEKKLKLPNCVFDYVYYTAAAPEHTSESYKLTYYTGLNNLLKILSNLPFPPRKIFFVSSTSVYGQNKGEWIDELSVTSPHSFSGQILLEAEKSLNEYPIPFSIIRFSGIYGPNRTLLIRRILENKIHYTKSKVYTNRIHETDCVGFLNHLLKLTDTEKIYLASDNRPTLLNKLIRWLAYKLKIDPETIPITAQSDNLRYSNKRCLNNKVIESGYQFYYPSFKEGFSDIIELNKHF